MDDEKKKDSRERIIQKPVLIDEVIYEDKSIALHIAGQVVQLVDFSYRLRIHLRTTKTLLPYAAGFITKGYNTRLEIPELIIPLVTSSRESINKIEEVLWMLLLRDEKIHIPLSLELDQGSESIRADLVYDSDLNELIFTMQGWTKVNPIPKYNMLLIFRKCIETLGYRDPDIKISEIGYHYSLDEKYDESWFEDFRDLLLELIETCPSRDISELSRRHIVCLEWFSMPQVSFRWARNILTEDGVDEVFELSDKSNCVRINDYLEEL